MATNADFWTQELALCLIRETERVTTEAATTDTTEATAPITATAALPVRHRRSLQSLEKPSKPDRPYKTSSHQDYASTSSPRPPTFRAASPPGGGPKPSKYLGHPRPEVDPAAFVGDLIGGLGSCTELTIRVMAFLQVRFVNGKFEPKFGTEDTARCFLRWINSRGEVKHCNFANNPENKEILKRLRSCIQADSLFRARSHASQYLWYGKGTKRASYSDLQAMVFEALEASHLRLGKSDYTAADSAYDISILVGGQKFKAYYSFEDLHLTKCTSCPGSPQHAIIPCGHICSACDACVARFQAGGQDCPNCKKPAQSILRVFT